MNWLKKLFGMGKKEEAPQAEATGNTEAPASQETAEAPHKEGNDEEKIQ